MRTTARRWGVSFAVANVAQGALIHDEEDGLVYNRARYLSPTLGRFLEKDPLEYVDSTNLYEAVRSNPSSLSDPTGLTLKISDPNDQKWFLDRLWSLAPDGKWYVDASGNIVPGNSGYCTGKSTCNSKGRPISFVPPGNKKSLLGQCLCKAASSGKTFTLYHSHPFPGMDGDPYTLAGGVSSPLGPVYVGPGRPEGYKGHYGDGKAPAKGPGLGLPADQVPSTPDIILAHELCGHENPGGEFQPHPVDGTEYTPTDPIIILENRYRSELGSGYGIREN
jgi:RHS repeat-associated protein